MKLNTMKDAKTEVERRLKETGKVIGERNTSDIIETVQAEKLLVDTARNVNIVQKKKVEI